MRRRASVVAFGLFVAGIGCSSVQAASDKAGPPPALGGQWTLDREQSELPRIPGHHGASGDEGQRPPEGPGEGFGPPPGGGMGGRGPGGMGGFGGGMGRPGSGLGGPGGGFGGSMPSPEEMAAVRSTMRSIMSPPLEMQIVQSERELVVQDANGVLSRLALDGRKVKSSDGVESRARWIKGQLAEEIKVAWIKIKRTYALAETDSGPKLVLIINVEDDRAGRQPRTYRCVYAPRTKAAAAPSPVPPPPPPGPPPSE
jgi:hypothetical protein